MKYFLFILALMSINSVALADFSAHIVRDDTVYPIVSTKIKGDVFHVDMMTDSIVNVGRTVYGGDIPRISFEAYNGETANSAVPVYASLLGSNDIYSQRNSKTNVVLNFSVRPEVSYVVFLTTGDRNSESSSWISLNSGHWLPYKLGFFDLNTPYSEMSAGGAMRKTVPAPIFNLPHDLANPHIDLRSIGSTDRNVAFMSPIADLRTGALKIICYDENKIIVPDGVLYSDWQHGVQYVGTDKYVPDGSLQYGYKIVSHDVIDNLTYVFGETVDVRAGQAVSVVPGPSEQSRGTREVHIGLVATEPTVIQLAAWSESYDSQFIVLSGDRSQAIRPLDRVSEKGRGDDLTVFDVVLRSAGVHKIILAYPGNKRTSDPQDIHLLIRRPGDAHLRPFTVQDSVLVD